jgi:hypothetical protein
MAASAMYNRLNAISQGKTTMRAPLIAMVLLMSSALVPAVAQDREHSPASDNPKRTPSNQSAVLNNRSNRDHKIGSRLRMSGSVAIGGPNSAMANARGKWTKTVWAA